MISDDKIIEIFYSLDDFMKKLTQFLMKIVFLMVQTSKNVIESLKCPIVG
jgi:hypothetical protein